MATTLGTLLLLIKGDTKDLKSKLSDADKSILSFAKNMTRMGNKLRSTGKQLTAELTLPLVGLAVAALKTAGSLDEFKAPLDEMRGALRGAMADILRGALPALQGLAKRVSEVAKWFTGLSDGTKKTILVLAGLAAAVGPVMVVVGRMVTLFGTLQRAFVAARVAALSFNASMLPNPIYLVVAALVALTIGANEVAKKLDPVKKAMKEITDQTKELAEVDREAGRRVLVMKIAEYTDKLAQATAELDAINEKVRKNPLGADQAALQRAIANLDNVKRVLNELGAQVAAYDRESNNLAATQGKLTEDQKTALAAMERLKSEFGQIDEKAALYGDEVDILSEKKRTLKTVIDDLVNKGFTAQGAAIQRILTLYGWLLAAEEAQAGAVEIHTEKLVEFAKRIDPLSKAAAARKAFFDAPWGEEAAEKTVTLTDKLEDLGAVGTEIFGQLSDVAGLMLQNRLAALDNEMAARRKAIEASITDETARAKAFEDLDTEEATRRKEIQLQQAKATRTTGIFQAIIDTAAAFVKMLSSAAPPLNFIAAGIVAALGAAKVALIAATPLPALAKGGSFIVPPGYPNDSFGMRVESGEQVDVTPADQVRQPAAALPSYLTLRIGNREFDAFIEEEMRDGRIKVAQRAVVR